MLRWLALLVAALYIGMVLGGQDRGQTRAGLQDSDAQSHPATAPLAVAQVEPADQAPSVQVLPAPVMASLPVVDAPAAAADPALDLRWVTANRANVRLEPNKNSPVTGKVTKGESLLVLWTEPSGWVRVRMEGDGVDGYIHKNLLTDQDPLSVAAVD